MNRYLLFKALKYAHKLHKLARALVYKLQMIYLKKYSCFKNV